MKLFNPSSENFHFSKKETKIIIILFLALFTFLCFKAALMGFFFDELLTFYLYLNPRLIYPPEAHIDANNHFLNTQLTRWTFQLFGPTPLSLRLPNVLSYPFYFFAVFKIAGRFKPTLIRWSFALSLTMCSFIFEYFAMSRGYGLSMMFLVTSVYFAMRLIDTQHPKHIVFVAILLWFGLAANLTILPYALLIFAFMAIHTLVYDFKQNRRRFFIKLGWMALLGSTFIIHACWAFELRDSGLLVHGALDSFYEVTIKSVSIHNFGKPFLFPILLVFIIFWTAVVLFFVKLIQQKSLKYLFSTDGFLIYMLITSVSLLFMMGKLMEINYPSNRTGMHLLIFLFGAFAALAVAAHKKWKWMQFSMVLLLFFPLQFTYYYDPADSLNFDNARHSDQLYHFVQQIEHDFKFPLTISSQGFQHIAFCYADYIHDKSLGSPTFEKFPQLEADLIFKEPTDYTPKIDSIYLLYDSVYYDQRINMTCFKRKQFLSRNLIHEVEIPPIENTNTEYLTFMKIESDSLNGEAIYLGVEMTLKAEHKPFKSRIVVAVDREEEPRNLFYDYVELDWLNYSYDGEHNNVVQGALINRVPQGGETVAIYLWNTDTTTFSIREGKCYLYRLD